MYRLSFDQIEQGCRNQRARQRPQNLQPHPGAGKPQHGKAFPAQPQFIQTVTQFPFFKRCPLFPVTEKLFLKIIPITAHSMQPHENFVILAAAHMPGFTVSAELFKNTFPKHHRRMNIGRVWQKILFPRPPGHIPAPPDPAFIQDLGSASHKTILRMTVEKFRLNGQTVRQGNIIIVHPGDIFSPGLPDTGVQPRGKPPVFLLKNQPDPFILPGEILKRPAGFGPGTVVQNEKFKVRQALGKNGVHRQTKVFKACGIKHTHNHTDFHRLVHDRSPFLLSSAGALPAAPPAGAVPPGRPGA